MALAPTALHLISLPRVLKAILVRKVPKEWIVQFMAGAYGYEMVRFHVMPL